MKEKRGNGLGEVRDEEEEEREDEGLGLGERGWRDSIAANGGVKMEGGRGRR